MPLRYFISINFACIFFTSSISVIGLVGIPVAFYLAGLSIWSVAYTLFALPSAILLLREDCHDYGRDKELFHEPDRIQYFFPT